MRSLSGFKRRLQGYRGLSERHAGLDLSAANAFGSNWSETTFEECDFSGAVFKNATFDRCVFARCTGRLADFSTATLTDCLFDTCSFPQSSFFATTFFATTFKTCDLAFALFNESSSRGLGFPDCNLHGADLRLREARLPVDWRGANLWGVQVGIGCAFFNGMFDERQLRIFASFVARRGGILAPEVCGKELALVNRLMREQE